MSDRHIVTVTFYVHGTAEEALKTGDKICRKINKKCDGNAEVEHIHKNEFAQLLATELNISDIRNQIAEKAQ